jgi:3-methylcrotonyl-CoA carboxylase alpha subunit
MKMEHTIRAPTDGTVDEFYFQAGDLVDGGSELLSMMGDGKGEQGIEEPGVKA